MNRALLLQMRWQLLLVGLRIDWLVLWVFLRILRHWIYWLLPVKSLRSRRPLPQLTEHQGLLVFVQLEHLGVVLYDFGGRCLLLILQLHLIHQKLASNIPHLLYLTQLPLFFIKNAHITLFVFHVLRYLVHRIRGLVLVSCGARAYLLYVCAFFFVLWVLFLFLRRSVWPIFLPCVAISLNGSLSHRHPIRRKAYRIVRRSMRADGGTAGGTAGDVIYRFLICSRVSLSRISWLTLCHKLLTGGHIFELNYFNIILIVIWRPIQHSGSLLGAQRGVFLVESIRIINFYLILLALWQLHHL